jgi:hypothetical protein
MFTRTSHSMHCSVLGLLVHRPWRLDSDYNAKNSDVRRQEHRMVQTLGRHAWSQAMNQRRPSLLISQWLSTAFLSCVQLEIVCMARADCHTEYGFWIWPRRIIDPTNSRDDYGSLNACMLSFSHGLPNKKHRSGNLDHLALSGTIGYFAESTKWIIASHFPSYELQ